MGTVCGCLLSTFGGGLQRSDDGGRTFTPLADAPPGCQRLGHGPGGRLGLVAEGGIWESTDNARSWTRSYATTLTVSALSRVGDTWWAIGGKFGGYNFGQVSLLLRQGPPTIDRDPAQIIPIACTLPAAGQATVVIEDAQGVRVRNLAAEEPVTAGKRTLWWDGRDDWGDPVPAGVYRWHGLFLAGLFRDGWTGPELPLSVAPGQRLDGMSNESEGWCSGFFRHPGNGRFYVLSCPGGASGPVISEVIDGRLDDWRMQEGVGIPVDEQRGARVALARDAADGTSFSSPNGRVIFDSVHVVAEARIAVQRRPEGIAIEAAIPLAALGWTPVPGDLRGDVGVIYGDQAGSRNIQRSYWANRNVGLVSDVGEESRLTPGQWGPVVVDP